MTTTIQLETWNQFVNDAPTLWKRIWDEFGATFEQKQHQKMLEPDIGMYSMLDMFGKLLVVTAREEKKLVGYTTTVLQRHPHYNTFIAFGDSTYLDKDYRKGLAGYKLLRTTEQKLRDIGAKRYFMPFYDKNMSQLYDRLGFKGDYEVYSKWLGD